MFVVYEKIIDDVTSDIRYVVKEFEKPEEAGHYIEQRLAALERLGYTYEIPTHNGEVECFSEKARKFRTFAIAEKKKFIPMREYEAMVAAEEKRREDMNNIMKKLGWNIDSIMWKKGGR